MDPSCADLLRCLLCCQDETDDYMDLSNALRIFRNLFKKGHSHSDDHTYRRINNSSSESYNDNYNIPISIPPDLECSQSSYTQKSPSFKPPQLIPILSCTSSSPYTPSSSHVYRFATKPAQSSYISPSSSSKPPQASPLLNLSNPSPSPLKIVPQKHSTKSCLSSTYEAPSSSGPQPFSPSSSPSSPYTPSSSPVYRFATKPVQSSYISPSSSSKPPQASPLLNLSNPSPSPLKIVPQQHSTKSSLSSTYEAPSSSGPQPFSPSSSPSSPYTPSSSPVYRFATKPAQSSYISPSSSSKPPQTSPLLNLSNPSPSPLKIVPQQHSTKSSLSSTYEAPSSSRPQPFSPSSSSSSQKVPLLTLKSALSGDTTMSANRQGKTNYEFVENDSSLPLYLTPENIKDLIKRDIVPQVLKKPLSPLRYKDYFSVLLYAEDDYYEKWSDYKLSDVTLELHKAAIYKKSYRRKNINRIEEVDEKIFVAFKIDAIPEKRPYLLSRDLVYARPSGSKVEPFQGIIYRVVKSNNVLVEFKDDFRSQHYSSRTYDISFSFNRVCLKRAHQALNSISDSVLENFLFPDCLYRNSSPSSLISNTHKLNAEISSTVHQISSIRGSPPYLIAGPRCSSEARTAAHLRDLSRTGVIIREAVIETYKSTPHCRILICSPSNSACDVLMRDLKKAIPELHMFRANAAFREIDDVPEDVLSSSLYKKECFVCPPLQRLRKFKVIFSTFVSSFRLHNQGLPVGYFSHIFMVDASMAIEPEAMVPLANFADKNTVVVVTGEVGSSPNWVRSEIGRKNGLKISYFERLCKCRPYRSLSPSFITQLN